MVAGQDSLLRPAVARMGAAAVRTIKRCATALERSGGPPCSSARSAPQTCRSGCLPEPRSGRARADILGGVFCSGIVSLAKRWNRRYGASILNGRSQVGVSFCACHLPTDLSRAQVAEASRVRMSRTFDQDTSDRSQPSDSIGVHPRPAGSVNECSTRPPAMSATEKRGSRQRAKIAQCHVHR